MSEESHLRIEVDEGILRVTIDRPEKRNALSRAVLAELGEAFRAAADDENLIAAVLQGAGDKSFAAGGDLKDLDSVRSRAQAAEMADDAKRALDAVRRFPVPVVAAVNGDAMGGGAELALACDFRLLASHARIGFLQGRLNIATAWGGGIDVLQKLGTTKGLWLLASREMVGGGAALDMGLADAVAEEGQSFETALAVFLGPMRRQVPQVMRAFKALALGVADGLERDALEKLETKKFSDTWIHDDHWSAVDKLLAGDTS
ncbi:MAG: enoyl-CoA hydratase/isomerase family protein [Alphaproteobacteria bacterium]|jgi:enoyl-CoA hydratase|nr:3-hydroxybutyryl-CoA dehydratase [Rhodospirillaceae bacterium]MDP6406058.1 enoyl-CoA hydratase/isomerase family protein [Alphaproteobacteria bacterium]MDP6622862.1 enoyl-CoA hydratase/isomerase family protein [Alphaproteobacteria bacterium]